MEVLSLIVFLTGVALATSQCSQSKIEQCLNMSHDTFESIVITNLLYDTSTLCSPSTITGFTCFKNEVNNCPEGVSFMDKEHVDLMNKLTAEDLKRSCSLLSKISDSSLTCISRVMSSSSSAKECFYKAGAAMIGVEMTSSEQQCRINDANYKCGLEPAKKVCAPNIGADMESLHEAFGILSACDYAGNGSRSCNTAPTFLLTVIGVVVLATIGS